ncbi:MAG: Methyltransferase domain protein [Candidatus Accumulibacter sp. BA-94]|jgi:SAM-dependent methyltransferase|uniref:methyltransferase domain-containing protein n=1 Tax=Accumulibacter sp. TaxID=2053492 RepID=UPI00045174BC|nr:methyltransferase domain-containing protein [Accumulibacter sp.]EXI83873.1 MAG: Methyltransferase domain protein [Candidatus Accumulibacter sp. BA-94]HRD86883.1 methyltransferase domain-containing protein [Accumulibacter sp.]
MHEASKTQAIRPEDFADRFLAGHGIDPGVGDDQVCPWVESNASHVTRYRQELTHDAVHSSHCLEHMHDPKSALRELWNLLKPEGKLIVVLRGDGSRRAPPLTISGILILLARLGSVRLVLQSPRFRVLFFLACAVDQTFDTALAHIQVVERGLGVNLQQPS